MSTIHVQVVVKYAIDVQEWSKDMACAPTTEAVWEDVKGYLTAETLLPHTLRHCMRAVLSSENHPVLRTDLELSRE